MYDALFARGLAESEAAVLVAAEREPPGVTRIRAGARAIVRWAVDNPALAQLLFWRPVPGFAPTAETFAASVAQMRWVRSEFAAAVRAGELAAAADSDDAVRLHTVVLSGLDLPAVGERAGSVLCGRCVQPPHRHRPGPVLHEIWSHRCRPSTDVTPRGYDGRPGVERST